MARPRIFVSSTYYDLKHLRSSLENFVSSLGFDAVLSEKGKIAYTPDIPLDESCYREVGTADIFVLIVGGRYGSEASSTKTGTARTFYERYNSITRGEYRAAVERGVPCYVLIERAVYAEYETFLRNKDNNNIKYAHVDSANIFHLIEEILVQPRNNPLQQFDRYSEIEDWLREQWAGLFRELLQRMQTQAQLSSLQVQVSQLAELNRTLKTYLEEVMSKIAPQESKDLIRSETERLKEAEASRLLAKNDLMNYLVSLGMPPSTIIDAATTSTSVVEFMERLSTKGRNPFMGIEELVLEDLDEIRDVLGLSRLDREEGQETPSKKLQQRRQTTKRKAANPSPQADG